MRQMFTDPAGLLRRHGDPHHLHAVVTACIGGQRAPAAAHIQQAHAGAQLQLFADQPELVILRFAEAACVAPVAAAVHHLRIQHRGIHAWIDVVVTPPHQKGAMQSLGVGELIPQDSAQIHQTRTQRERPIAIAAQQPADQLIQLLAIPITAHIAIAQRQGAVAQQRPIEARIVHLQIPGPLAVELHIGGLDDRGQTGRNGHGTTKTRHTQSAFTTSGGRPPYI